MLLLTEFITSGAKCGAREEGYSQGAPYIDQKRKFPFTLNVNSLYSAVQYSVLLKTEALVREASLNQLVITKSTQGTNFRILFWL